MAFKRSENPRDLELTSLIDIVFLLLIFFLVSFAFSMAGDVSQSKAPTEIALPKSNVNQIPLKNNKLLNLMIQVMPDTSGASSAKSVYILWPSYREGVILTEDKALEKTLQDSTFSAFPENYLSLPKAEFVQSEACKLISFSIKEFVEREKILKQNERPIIEVKAEKNTEFKILNFILEQCSLYEDSIPQIIFRTAI